jgi:hypothetical protein
MRATIRTRSWTGSSRRQPREEVEKQVKQVAQQEGGQQHDGQQVAQQQAAQQAR